MRLLHYALAASFPALKLIRRLGNFNGRDSSSQLRVLLYHDIRPGELKNFERQLIWLSHSWTFISPYEFSAIISGESKLQKNSLLLTFDDGFASNVMVAEKILNPMKIKALFFVISDLVAIDNHEEALQFIVRHLQWDISLCKIPDYFGNMKWTDLESLLGQGHTIGAHTRTHARLSEIISSDCLVEEIVSSADRLENRLGVPVEHFAYTFGDLASFSSQALSIAKQRFQYVFSGLRGNNPVGTSSFAIRRDSLKPSDPNSLMGALLLGGADFMYRSSLNQLDGWAGRGSNDIISSFQEEST